MKITKGGLFHGLISSAADAGAVGGVTIDNSPSGPGQALVSNQSNFNSPNGASWAPIIQGVSANGSNTLLGPFVNFASGSNVTFSVSSNTLTIHGQAGGGDFLTITNGGGGTVNPLGNLTGTINVNTALGNYHWGTFTGNTTFTFTTTVDTAERWFTLELIEGAGGHSPTWPGTVTWLGGTTPTHTTTAGTTTIYAFFTRNGGTTWVGGQLGGGSSMSFATPAIVLGTAAAAGVASTVIRSDSTIVAFDATVPVTQAFGDTAATGAAAVAARRDHRHGMPAATHYEVLMASGFTPPEPLETGDGLDWLYVEVP